MESIVAKKVIGVEGKDDKLFIESLLKYLGITDVQIIQFEGKSNFKSQILALRNTPGFAAIEICAFIRDADENPPNSAFISVSGSLTNAGIVPPVMDQTFTESNPKVGIYIFPGNGNSGMIEDLCLESIRDENNFACVEKYFECINTIPNKAAKAKVLCYLSGKEPYANTLGYAAAKGHWDYTKETFSSFSIFLKNFK